MKALVNKIVRLKQDESLGLVKSQMAQDLEITAINAEMQESITLHHLSLDDVEEVENAKIMTLEEFAEEINNNYYYDEMLSEMKRYREADTDKLFTLTLKEAQKRGVYISDVNEADYDRFFYSLYQAWEQ